MLENINKPSFIRNFKSSIPATAENPLLADKGLSMAPTPCFCALFATNSLTGTLLNGNSFSEPLFSFLSHSVSLLILLSH